MAGLYSPFSLIALAHVTMAGYWTVADQHFATRQTEDVSIIRAARRSATCDGVEGHENLCNLIATQNKSREDEQGGNATKEAGRMGH